MQGRLMRVEIDSVTKTWPSGGGLPRLSLIAEPGELLVITGRSGSGKTTLLGLVAGWCQPDAGTVRLGGAVPRSVEPWSAVALVPQRMWLAPELSLRENIEEAAGTDAANRATVTMLIERLGLDECAARFPNEVSSGQQQRAAVARAVIARPAVLLADEPTAFQDQAHAHDVMQLMQETCDRGTTIIVVSHDPIALSYATRHLDIEDAAQR